MATFTWTIGNLERKTADGFITIAHWTCNGVDGEINSSVYNTCSFEDGTPETPYEQVTEEMVLGWIWAHGVDKDAVEQSIADRIEALKNPVSAAGVPWASA